jgi:hypothetical protein
MGARPDYVALGRKGGLTTASRHSMSAVAANARKSSPSSLDFWVAKQPADLPASDREARAEAARRLWFTKLAAKSAASRKRKASDAKTTDLTEPAALNDYGDTTSDVRAES